jgi:PAS domain S-box-containing protein
VEALGIISPLCGVQPKTATPLPLKVLIVEHSPEEVSRLVAELRRAGFEPDWQQAQTEAEYLDRLQASLNLVLADDDLPEFGGLRALELLRRGGLDIPCILVSSTTGEDRAVTAMKQGATDYLIRSQLDRLGQSVSQALESARLRAERRRVDQLLLLQGTALETVADAVVITDAGGIIRWVNPAFTAQSGYPAGEAIGQNPRLLKSGQHHRAFYEHLWATLLAGGTWRGGVTNRRKDGGLYLAENAITPVRSPDGTIIHFVAIMHDVTMRTAAEEALRRSEERFRQVVENIHEVFWMTDVQQDTTLYVSPGYEAIWGRTCESRYASPHSWTENIHELDRARVLAAARARQSTGTYDESYRIVRPDGGVRWIHDRAFPVKDQSAAVTRVVGVAEDITERKKLEEQFLRAQRLESVGMLASGIAHDLNNILAPIGMVAPLLRANASDPDDLRMLDTLERCAERGAGLVRQILGFVSGIGGEPTLVQVRHLFNDIIAVARETFPKSIVIRPDVPAGLWPILANVTQIHQVLLNLCVNARDAMPHGGVLTLGAENQRLDEAAAGAIPGARPGAWLVLSVEDSGAGIPPDVLARMWEPFFTTKSAETGTGLGLSTVRGIVNTHRGFITLDTVAGRGTVFRVYLPALAATETTDSNARPAATASGHNELILFVDDEEGIRTAASTFLTRAGYRVLTAADGRSGLILFDAHAREIALVITDHDMPNLDGASLARTIRSRDPTKKIISISGLAGRAGGAGSPGTLLDAFVAKPFAADTLLQTVEQLLRRAAQA